MFVIRAERPDDHTAVHDLNCAAFATPAEAALVDALRKEAHPLLSLVAAEDDVIVGHILFSPVTLAPARDVDMMGLAPMAVAPARQRQGIGSALVHAGIEGCRRLNAVAIVVLGHPGFYPRFGFTPASEFGLRSEYDVPDEAFMALELTPGALRGTPGTVRYHEAFAAL